MASRSLAAGDLVVQLMRKDASGGDDARDRGSEIVIAPLRTLVGTAVGRVSEMGDADAPDSSLGRLCHARSRRAPHRLERDALALDGAQLARV